MLLSAAALSKKLTWSSCFTALRLPIERLIIVGVMVCSIV